MAKAFTIAALYTFALACLYVATTTAPDMTWPATFREYLASALLLAGLLAKFAGHSALLSYSRGAR